MSSGYWDEAGARWIEDYLDGALAELATHQRMEVVFIGNGAAEWTPAGFRRDGLAPEAEAEAGD